MTTELRVFDDIPSARGRGRREGRQGATFEQNPFDPSTHPALAAAWAEGWRAEARRPQEAMERAQAR